MKKQLLLLLRWMVGLVLLIFIFKSVDFASLIEKFSVLHPGWILFLCLATLIDRVLMAFKWLILLSARGIRVSLGEATRLYFIGPLLGTFTPSGIGSEAYRILALSRFGKSGILLSSVFLERAIGLLVMSLTALATLPVSSRHLPGGSQSLIWIVPVVVLIGGGLLFLSLRPELVQRLGNRAPLLSGTRFAEKLNGFYKAYAEYRFFRKALIQFTFYTFLEFALKITTNYLAARALGIPIPFLYFFCVLPILHIVVRLPISFHAIGVQEGLFAFFLIKAGFSAAEGLSISLLLRAVEAIFVFLPAATMLLLHPIKPHSQKDGG